MRENTEHETSSAFGGLLVAIAVLLAFVYAFGDSNTFANLLSNLIDRAGAML